MKSRKGGKGGRAERAERAEGAEGGKREFECVKFLFHQYASIL